MSNSFDISEYTRSGAKCQIVFTFFGGYAPTLSACYWGLPGPEPRGTYQRGLRPRTPGLPPAGPLLDAQKWAEKPLGTPQTPVVCPIGRLQGGYPVATEPDSLASDLRRVSILTSASGPVKGVDVSVFRATRNTPQPEGRQAKCGRAPHRSQGSQRPHGNSVAARYQSRSVRLDKNRGPGSPWRFFGDFLCVQKVTRVRAGEAREPAGLKKSHSEDSSSDKRPPPAGDRQKNRPAAGVAAGRFMLSLSTAPAGRWQRRNRSPGSARPRWC